MSDNNHHRDSLEKLPRSDADKGREPRLVPARHGTITYSIAALVERLIAAFVQEHADHSAALLACQTRADRLKLLRDSFQHLIAVEAIALTDAEQAEVMKLAYSELFAYGPLDDFFSDEGITTVTFEGLQKLSIRRGNGEITAIDPVFDDYDQFVRIVARLLRNAGVTLKPEMPFVETGLIIEGRRASLSLFAPPVSPLLSLVVRLHPRQLPDLSEMVTDETMRALVQAIARSPHGVIVVGEAESGKTTLISHLAHLALSGEEHKAIAVERAGELNLPEGVERLVVQWGNDHDEGAVAVTFGEQIAHALHQAPGTLILDEIRADEPQTIAPLLTNDPAPRLIAAFRGTANSKRLAAALGTLARMSDPQQSEAMVRALYERLPFVMTVRQRDGRLHLHSIAEWQLYPGAEYPDFIELAAMGWGSAELTGKRPRRPLDLPAGFWG